MALNPTTLLQISLVVRALIDGRVPLATGGRPSLHPLLPSRRLSHQAIFGVRSNSS